MVQNYENYLMFSRNFVQYLVFSFEVYMFFSVKRGRLIPSKTQGIKKYNIYEEFVKC